MTMCHFGVKLGRNILKIGTRGNFRSENSNMTSIFEIKEDFINYSWNVTSLGREVRIQIYNTRFWKSENDFIQTVSQ